MTRPRFYLLNNERFAARIPGEAPTEPERVKFKSAKLTPGMSERKIWFQVGAVIHSVLNAAECTTLSFSHLADRKAKGGNPGNTAGIYRDPPVFKTADESSDNRADSKGDGKVPSVNTRSCFWLEVPVHVKSDESDAVFFFNSPKRTNARSRRGEGPEDNAQGQQMGVSGAEREDGDTGKRDEIEDGEQDGTEVSGGDKDDEDSESEEDDWWAHAESEKSSSDPVLSYLKRCYPSFVNVTEEGMKALDKFVQHQSTVFKYQHRTFCYSIYICFDMARLLYIDHAGALVSEPFSWVEPTSLLHEFVWKLANLAKANKRADMGHDTTTAVVSPVKRSRFVREAKNTALAAHIRAGLDKAAAGDCPLYELTVKDVPPSPHEWFPDEPFQERSSSSPSPTEGASSRESTSEPPASSTPSTHRFIVGRPHFSSDAIVGRCTKGFMAFDVTDPQKWVPCFLKDAWRPCVSGRTRPEHLVYERLRRMNVGKEDGIATLICGGDVGGRYAQRTQVQNAMPREERTATHVHYRLVTEDIGMPLSEFRNFGELSSVFADVLKAHRKVWEDAKILHHDISIGNIMIRVEGEKRMGFLIDWDLAVVESELPVGIEPVKRDRMGTWLFCSAASLLYPRKPYRHSDDIESFVHVFTYLVLRYHETDEVSAKETSLQYFEARSLIGGFEVGGSMKSWRLRCGTPPFEIWDNAPLDAMLSKIFGGCSASYARLDTCRMQYTYGPEEKPLPMPTPAENTKIVSRWRGARRARAILRSDEISQLEASGRDGEDRLFKEERRVREDPPPLPLCTMDEFLASPEGLIKLFEEFARQHTGANDKALDQFIPRTCEYPYPYPKNRVRAGNLGNATLAGNASVASTNATGGAPKAETLDNSSAPAQLSSMNPDVSAKKRTHPGTVLENRCVDELLSRELDSERRPKRQKIQSNEEGREEDVERGR